MVLKAGTILTSTTEMDDLNFKGCFVLVTSHGSDGSIGLIINKMFPKPLNALSEFSTSLPFPLYNGGPVDEDHLYFIHRRSDLIPGGESVTGDLYFGGEFLTAVNFLDANSIDGSEIKIFVGYCGWDHSELEQEIKDGFWKEVSMSVSKLFL